MPQFEPFKGLRYDPNQVRLDQVIAPPYDVIESQERVRLANRHPANSVLVELPEADLFAGIDRYQAAVAHLTRWQASRILVPDPTPSFYAYRMTLPDGRTSNGVIGALGLQEPGPRSDILPHEQTLPKAKSDRLDLLRATHANLSPIWGLSMSSGLSATFVQEEDAHAEAFDDDGVRHQLWVVSEPDVLDAISKAVAAAPIVIADGHHRYETALAFQREQRDKLGEGPADHDAVMALVVELAEDQLNVGPIHRSVSGLPPEVDLVAAFSEFFDVVRAGPADERTVSALGQAQSMALITSDAAWMLTPHPEAYDAAGSDLDSSLVALVLDRLPAHENVFRNSWQDAARAVFRHDSQAAVLLRPVTVDQISQWADARRRMPPKSTYFSPKPRTGMVFRQLAE
jgi:uncharacterized protein (DUF1015 family)